MYNILFNILHIGQWKVLKYFNQSNNNNNSNNI